MNEGQREVAEHLAGFCEKVIGTRRPGLEEDFEAVGLDSLDLIELVMEVEQHFGCPVSNEVMGELRTLRDLAVVARPT